MADDWWLSKPRVLEPMPLGMHCKPWYKDRLPSKCFAKHKNKLLRFPTSLNSRQWIFVKEGLDDFRTGCPPCEGLITRGPKEAFLPMISHRVPQPAPKTSRRKLTKEAGLFSTLSPAQLARKAFVENVEARLTEHPLALYPNLEEDIPADLLLKVLQVLDPDRKLEDTWAFCEGHRKRTKEPTKLCQHRSRKVFLNPPKIPGSHRNNSIHEETPSAQDLLPESLKHKHIPRGVRSFCKWVATFGDSGIDEEFIMKQFEVDYAECKPTHKDLHIKKVSQLPSELNYVLGLKKKEKIKFSIQEPDIRWKLHKPQNLYQPNWVKMRYGAWYLKPKLWKKLINDEPLIDPKVLLETQGECFGKAPEKDILEELYGTIAFKDFILSKGYRMPEFLEKLFIRKGWTYDSVKTPIDRVIKMYLIVEDDAEEHY
ncbi:PREDICTED: protein FAM47E-like [Galeopterus variegatus]|uniref:Protein FAM47E-like n=1 Tax=Galeopterus variegatus TaxID=482537 RepID=A0ABM0SAD0_GALVR|nr:PREDICTED: protein FAM47E-like [Galeopterus variegatus]